MKHKKFVSLFLACLMVLVCLPLGSLQANAAPASGTEAEAPATKAKPTITSQPKATTATEGNYPAFTVVASGSGLTYRWQVSKDSGSTWSDINTTTYPSAKTPTLTFLAKMSMNGYKYRCVVSNSSGSVNSTGVKLTVKAASGKPTIVQEPEYQKCKKGQTVTFEVVAMDATTYQWQYSKNQGETWVTWSGKTQSTLPVTGSSTNSGCEYRCKVSNSKGSVYTSSQALFVTDVKATIYSQPSNASAHSGEEVSFTTDARGWGMTYQWQVSKDGGTTWKNINPENYPYATYRTLTFTATVATNGNMYRCKVTNDVGTVTSQSAQLTILEPTQKPTIVVEPEYQICQYGETVTFEVVAIDARSYQWEYSKDQGQTWVVWKGKTSSTLTVTGSTTNTGCEYRCKVSNSKGYVYTQEQALFVTDVKPRLVLNPSDTTVKAGQEASFTAGGAGWGMTFQWQVSKDGGSTWKDIDPSKYPDAVYRTFNFTASAKMNGYMYRCVITNDYGHVTSKQATLTVN